MDPAPLVILNGYPGVGKSAVASALRDLIPNSRTFDNHLLIDPVAALLEREDVGYRDLRKALRDPFLECIATNPSLRPRTVITTYYQETFTDRAIDLEEFYHSAKRGGRPCFVFILTCSEEENIKRLSNKSRESKSKLRDVKILEDILKNHFVYSFHDAGFTAPDVQEYRLDTTSLQPRDAAAWILDKIKKHHDYVDQEPSTNQE